NCEMRSAWWSFSKESIKEVTISWMKGSNSLMRLGTNALATALRNRVWAAPSLSTTLGTNGYPWLSSANTAGVKRTTGRSASRDEKTSGWLKIEKMSSYLVTIQACSSSL